MDFNRYLCRWLIFCGSWGCIDALRIGGIWTELQWPVHKTLQSPIHMSAQVRLIFSWECAFFHFVWNIHETNFLKFPSLGTWQERTWQNQFIQKFAKTVPSIPSCAGGQFLQILDELILSSTFLCEMDFSYHIFFQYCSSNNYFGFVILLQTLLRWN